MIAHTLTYGNVSSSEHGVYISGEGVYNAPERVVELVSIPGRNGALTIDQGHFDNITIEYPCFTFATSQEEFRRIVNNFKNAMIAQGGYQRLSDDYNPDEYRMALFVEGIEFEPVQYGRAGSFTLSFNCKPQRYLTDGDNEVTITNGSTLNNPTLYDAEPLLQVEGYGDIEFNGYKVTIENATMGNVIALNRGSYSSADASFNTTLTFNKSMFNTGDALTLDMGVQIRFSLSKNNSTASHSGNGTHELTGGRTACQLIDTLPINLNVGTSSTDTDTLTMSLRDSNNNSHALSVVLTSVFDGDETITLSVAISGEAYAHYQSSPTNVLTWSNVVGDSSLLILGHPTYIDCEIGEAYKYENGSLVGLNSYIDLGSDLPKLSSGINQFTLSDTITSLIVVPRFWQL